MHLSQELDTKLHAIQKVFRLKDILSLQMTKAYIKKYYATNQLSYSLFHTLTDRMYMGISRDGVYKDDDLLEAARIVAKYIRKLNAKSVLELATGRGATSFYLASHFGNVQFYGIDLSPGQLFFAKKKAKKVHNYYLTEGDYHDVTKFSDEQFDIVFVIEALCYSREKGKVLKGVRRILRGGGVCIIFDGYLKKPHESLTKQESLAKKLAERGLAVGNFEEYSDFLKTARTSDFTIEEEDDVSYFILPTLYRFERLAKIFFHYPQLAKFITKIFPKEFTYNAIPGLLMSTLIKLNIGGYFITILRK